MKSHSQYSQETPTGIKTPITALCYRIDRYIRKSTVTITSIQVYACQLDTVPHLQYRTEKGMTDW